MILLSRSSIWKSPSAIKSLPALFLQLQPSLLHFRLAERIPFQCRAESRAFDSSHDIPLGGCRYGHIDKCRSRPSQIFTEDFFELCAVEEVNGREVNETSLATRQSMRALPCPQSITFPSSVSQYLTTSPGSVSTISPLFDR